MSKKKKKIILGGHHELDIEMVEKAFAIQDSLPNIDMDTMHNIAGAFQNALESIQQIGIVRAYNFLSDKKIKEQNIELRRLRRLCKKHGISTAKPKKK